MTQQWRFQSPQQGSSLKDDEEQQVNNLRKILYAFSPANKDCPDIHLPSDYPASRSIRERIFKWLNADDNWNNQTNPTNPTSSIQQARYAMMDCYNKTQPTHASPPLLYNIICTALATHINIAIKNKKQEATPNELCSPNEPISTLLSKYAETLEESPGKQHFKNLSETLKSETHPLSMPNAETLIPYIEIIIQRNKIEEIKKDQTYQRKKITDQEKKAGHLMIKLRESIEHSSQKKEALEAEVERLKSQLLPLNTTLAPIIGFQPGPIASSFNNHKDIIQSHLENLGDDRPFTLEENYPPGFNQKSEPTTSYCSIFDQGSDNESRYITSADDLNNGIKVTPSPYLPPSEDSNPKSSITNALTTLFSHLALEFTTNTNDTLLLTGNISFWISLQSPYNSEEYKDAREEALENALKGLVKDGENITATIHLFDTSFCQHENEANQPIDAEEFSIKGTATDAPIPSMIH